MFQSRHQPLEIDGLISQLTNSNEVFDFEIYFSEVFHANGGFDVIIANPPYVDSEVMVREQPATRIAIGERFSTTRGNWDLYIPFLELSIRRLSRRGTSCLITPNKWLAITYGQTLRAFIKDMIYTIADYSRFRAFETVGVFPVVELSSPIEKRTIAVERFSDDHKPVFSANVSRDTFVQMPTWGAVLSEHLPLVLKLITHHTPLKKICSPEEAFTVSEAYDLPKLLRDNGKLTATFKFVNTGTIEPFFSLWGYSQTTYLKKKYLHPTISKNAFKQQFPKRYIQMSSPKIVISGMRHFESILDLDGDVIAGKSTVVIRGINHDDEWLCLLGILNSQLVKFFLKECYSALAMDGGINFSPTNVGEIPIAAPFTSKKLCEFVRKIVAIRARSGPDLSARDSQALTSLTDSLDEEVFDLYKLTKTERAIVRDGVNA